MQSLLGRSAYEIAIRHLSDAYDISLANPERPPSMQALENALHAIFDGSASAIIGMADSQLKTNNNAKQHYPESETAL